MEDGTVNDLNGVSGGGGGGGGGLTRFRSAPATWLDALLEDEDSLKLCGPHHPPPPPPPPLTSSCSRSTTTMARYISDPDPGFFHPATSSSGFHRMNSSPAEFLSGNADAYFASYGLGQPSLFDFVPSTTSTAHLHVSPSSSIHNHLHPSPSFPKEEQLSATTSGLLDLEMEKLLEDSVPCRVRAKRGCATHPRSIAERVRRTRISDRIRKLQELVPNMDKQTNTADMLEEAVEYVKTLQRQIQELTEVQKKCTCVAKS